MYSLRNLFKKDPETNWDPSNMGNYGLYQSARDSDMELKQHKLLQVLFECFPSFKTLNGEERTQQFELLRKHFDIVHWKVQGQPNNGRYYNPNYSNPIEKSYLVAKFGPIKLRGSRVQNFGYIYAVLTVNPSPSSPVPILSFWNWEVNWYGYKNPDREQTTPDMWWKEARHPHVSNADPCLGGFDNMMYKAGATGQVLQYFELIRNFLLTWNRHSAFFDMNRFQPLKDINGKTMLAGAQADKLYTLVGNGSYLKDLMPMIVKHVDDERQFLAVLRVLSNLYNKVQESFYKINRWGNIDIQNRRVEGESIHYAGAFKYKKMYDRLMTVYNRSWEYYNWQITKIPDTAKMTHPLHVYFGAKNGQMHFQWVLTMMKRFRSALNTFLYPDPSPGMQQYSDNMGTGYKHPATEMKKAFFTLCYIDDSEFICNLILTEWELHPMRRSCFEDRVRHCVDIILDILWHDCYPQTEKEWDRMFYNSISFHNPGLSEHSDRPLTLKWLDEAIIASQVACGMAKHDSLTAYAKEIANEVNNLKDDKEQNQVLPVTVSF